MEIVHYVRTLRRRWRMIAALVVAGALIGVLTYVLTGDADPSRVSFFKATHTLSAPDNTTNLQQLAIFATDGDVPKNVAARLGGSPASLAQQIVPNPQPEVGLLQLTAIDTDPNRAVQLADTFADELIKYQGTQQDRNKESQKAQLLQQLDQVKEAYATALEQAKNDPSNEALYKSQKDQAIKQGNEIQDQIAALDRKSVTTGGLASTSTAEAAPFSGQAVAALFEQRAKALSGNKDDKKTSSASTEDVTTAFAAGPRKMPLTTRAGIGAFAGLLLGCALALIIDRLDPRIRSKVDAEEAFGWPVIAELPALSRKQQQETEVLAYEQPRSRYAEALRVLRTALLFANTAPKDHLTELAVGTDGAGTNGNGANGTPAGPGTETAVPSPAAGKDHDARVIMITSPSPSEGKTTTTANLAAVLGEAGYSVLVINCDFRRPKLHDYLGGDDVPQRAVSAEVPNVKLITQVVDHPEAANPADVVATQRQVIRRARTLFDIVLLDTAPLLTTNDAAEVLAAADQVILVARNGKTNKDAADRAAELLERRNAPVVGVVVVGTEEGVGGRYYYYGGKGYYLDEHARRDDTDQAPGAPPPPPPPPPRTRAEATAE